MSYSFEQTDRERELITVEHFMNLSAEINYILSAKQPNPRAMLSLVVGPLESIDETSLLLALRLLQLGYAQSKRKIGPLAVLHPLRTAALLARTMDSPSILDLLGALLHDKGEDLQLDMIPEKNRAEFEQAFDELQERISQEERWYLGERLDLLTRKPGTPYHAYLVELLGHARTMPDLLHIKLADRFDNTLDNHIDRPGVIRYNFYRSIFDILFVPHFRGVHIRQYHFLPSDEEGGTLLMQLFKNAVFLSLLRSERLDRLDATTIRLFDAVTIASIREAQWIALELIAAFRETDLPRLRAMLLETMEYCYGGGATEVHASRSDKSRGLDGLFLNRYAIAGRAERKNQMAKLFADKDYLLSALVTFIATFASFLNDPNFSIGGIDRDGIHAVE